MVVADGVSEPSKASIRDPRTSSHAVPAEFEGALAPITVSGFKLTWKDRARDEDGYLLEMKPEGDDAFTVSAMMAPNVNSFGYTLTPPVRRASVRVRAFYYGEPSNLETRATGAAPDRGGEDD